ncbi:MAG: GNAT family N-acetyltransferase [Sulfobacillus sp.]
MKPKKFLVRRAQPGDAEAIVRVHVASWRTTYHDLLDPTIFDDMEKSLDQRIARQDEWLARPDIVTYVATTLHHHIVGFINGGPARRHDLGLDAELYAIYLLSGWQKSGVGTALVRQLAQSLQVRGYHSLLVWVLSGNPSRSFYERLGGRALTESPITIGSQTLDETAYGWDDIAVVSG